jgi:SAM-dependent methyltransferase
MPPEPWTGGDKIPWDEPGFSERMLVEHLSQDHDAASRRDVTIDAQVSWITSELLGAEPKRVLDLGCGPGLYAQRLARLGHHVRGIDFSPASIRYAREQASAEGLAVDYVLGDVRGTDFGGPYDLVMFLFGEINVFRPAEAAAILEAAAHALVPGGRLILEASLFEAVQGVGEGPARAQPLEAGLFSPRPHDLLEETFWNEARSTAIHRWYVIDRESDEVDRYGDTVRAYRPEEYVALLETAGFSDVEPSPEWPLPEEQHEQLVLYAATAP